MSSSVHSEPGSEFRIEKARTEATLTLSNGEQIAGCFFVSGGSATHAGPERIRDVLNAEAGFFPFEVSGPQGRLTRLYNRRHVVVVAMAGTDEAQSDPGYELATKRTVSMLLSDGLRLGGVVSVYRPQGRDRLSDFARSPERFQYLESGGATYLVNVAHLLELTEEFPQP